MDQGDAPTRLFHVRMVSVMGLMMLVDVCMLYYSIEYTVMRGPTMMIIFGFEYTLLMSLSFSTMVKYALHSVDMHSENGWDDKSMYIFYLDLVIGIPHTLTL